VIVVDTQIIAYFIIKSDHTVEVSRARGKDPNWAAPLLWRSEFRNVLVTSMRVRGLSAEEAFVYYQTAQSLSVHDDHTIATKQILNLTAKSRCTAYDCEFVALALQLGCPLLTCDKAILREFSDVAVSPDRYIATA
jgi:predicted nucleic acid-binding protein